MPANYNKTAWFYDALSWVVFGNTLQRAQVNFLPYIPANAQVLIVGGGTGKILEALTTVHPDGLHICYAEIAANMISISRKRNTGSNTVEFLNLAVEDINMPGGFDVLITGFVLDNYTQQQLPQLVAHLKNQLKPGGLWLNTDFQLTGKWWQKLLMKTMYRFFKLFADIKPAALPDIEGGIRSEGFNMKAQQSFYGDFIGAQVWEKVSAK
ncbi:class I SAM-dependent methyltransferase [Mucilaginibacter limnophilus]|uniref:Class I SAM-dependent methyltransferase n=1 Tax=Mucilaginibacter limnophilus TaxID=1932778 RepID=A0A3S2Y455_9SPHI|nr:class I SAM-dependent methyltransferase [Mucilaginibacter limnophilus]RVU01565.1 class I SAM-dependent methyltransferase [Mucilaginibacter limnophilus]